MKFETKKSNNAGTLLDSLSARLHRNISLAQKYYFYVKIFGMVL